MGGMAYMCKNRHGTYYARFIIPKQLQPHFKNKREIRRSLQTDSRRLAVKRARVFRVQFESIVDQLMSKADNTTQRAKQIIDSLFADKTKLQEDTVEQFAKEMRTNAGKFNNDLSKTQLITVLDPQGYTTIIDYDGDMEKEVEARRLITSTSAHPTPPPSKKLSEYFKDYVKHQTARNNKGGWKSPATQKNKTEILSAFCSEAGDKPAAHFDWNDAKKYIKLAHAIPPYFRNPAHAAKFEGITIEMLLDDNIDTSKFSPRKPSVVWNDLKTVRAFLDWLRLNERVKELQDPINALDIEIKCIDQKSERRTFTIEELKILFEQDNPAEENYLKSFKSNRAIGSNIKYWLPLLGLYTGATMAELCQLHLSDVYQHKAFNGSEHWVIDINDDADKQLKNTNHRPRLIPIHKNLLGLGLLDYIKGLRSKGETKLFPSAKRKDGQYGLMSKWWGEYSSNAGITDKAVTFHSFRHNMNTYLSDNHVDRDILAAISGHTISTMGKTTYRTGGHRKADIGPLVKVINSIDYGLQHQPFKLKAPYP